MISNYKEEVWDTLQILAAKCGPVGGNVCIYFLLYGARLVYSYPKIRLFLWEQKWADHDEITFAAHSMSTYIFVSPSVTVKKGTMENGKFMCL